MLKAVYTTQEDIPENFRDLYAEKNGQFEVTGIAGIKTQADVDRVMGTLQRERDEHKATKDKLTQWGDLDHADVLAKLDRIPELELAAKGKLDDAQIEDLVTKRVEASKNSLLAPVQRDLEKKNKALEELTAQVQEYQAKETRRTIHDTVRKAMVEQKVRPEAQDDVLMWAERLFEIGEDGDVRTRDGVGVHPGLLADQWLTDVQTTKPHWWGQSGGGGARGGDSPGGGNNPFASNNMTARMLYIKEHGNEKAEQMARAAGLSSTMEKHSK